MRAASPGLLRFIAAAACAAWGAAAGGGGAGAASGGIRLIGAGLPRTGTQSLHRALELLGYHGSHGEDLIYNKAVRITWEAWLYDGAPFDPALQSLLDAGMDATSDIPFYIAYEELHKRYPDAKVLLSVRDTPEAWYRSTHAFVRVHPATHVFGQTLGELSFRFVSLLLGCAGAHCKHALVTRPFRDLYGCDFSVEDPAVSEQACVDVYQKHIEQVRKAIPAEQLLVFNVKEGWKPLCDFLGVPVPDMPFPRTDWKNFRSMIGDIVAGGDTPGARLLKTGGTLVAVTVGALVVVATLAGLRWAAKAKQKVS